MNTPATSNFITPDFDNIPAELRQRDAWVLWRYEHVPNRGLSKVPYNANRSHRKASSTNANTWASFSQVASAFEASAGTGSPFTGIGLVLDGSGLAGVDIDHCVTDGKPDPKALAMLDGLEAAYVEVSPSGTGLRAFGYADNLGRGCNGTHNGLKVELYTTERYLTLTGHAIKTGPLRSLTGFGELAESIRSDRKVNPDTGEIVATAIDEHHATLMQRVLSGDVYHDSLRDLAASLVATGMQPGAVVNHLRGLIDNSNGPHDERWKARRAQIPDLVNSASAKFEPLDFPDMVEKARASNESRYKLLGADELRNLPPLAWRVRGVLPAVGLAALYGPSASGKSFLAFDMAAAIAEGQRWFDCRVETAPVVYVALEGEAGFKLRAQAWELSRGRALPDGLRMMLQPFKLTDPQDVADLAAVVPADAVVVVDTLNRAAPTADENSSRDMGEILEASKRLQAVTGGLVVLVHHTGKDSSRGLRGHSSLFAAMDAAIEVSREGDRRGWKVAKSKDGTDGAAHPFKLSVEMLGTEPTGEEITSCVVVRDTAAQDVRTVRLPQGGNQRVILDALRPMFKDGQAGKLGAPLLRPCIELEAAVSGGAAKLTCPTDRRATRTREAITGLVARGVLGCNEGWLWLV